MDVWKMVRAATVFLITAVLVEIFVFNWNHWGSLGYTGIDIPLDYCIYQGRDESYTGDGVLLIDNDGNNLVQFTIAGSGVKAENILLDVTCIDGDDDWWGYLRTKYAHIESPSVRTKVLLSKGEENTLLRDKILSGAKPETVSFPVGSEPELISILLTGIKGKQILLKGMQLNVEVPFNIVPMRMIMCFFSMCFLYGMRFSSVLWKIPLLREDGKPERSTVVTAWVIFISLMIMCAVLMHRNQIYIQSEGDFKPYSDLARAFAKGQLYLELEPSEELKSLADPYDPVAREEITAPFQLDYAYYEGKYYIYFGVIPCLILYLPFYLITHTDLPGWVALCVMLGFIYSGIWLLIKEAVKRYMKNASIAVCVCLWLGASSALSLPAVMGDACNYYQPMLSSVAFLLYGMVFCLKAVSAEDDRKKRILMIVLSSICMAFIAGCRPQLVLGAVCTLPVIIPMLFPLKEGKRSIDIRLGIAFAVPYVLVAVMLMVYNTLRFGSPFDFGAMYNLTFAYLSEAGFNLVAGIAGIFYYLFKPPTIGGNYPYLDRSYLNWSNPNMLANHPSTGGLFMLYPIMLGALAVFIPAKNARSKELKQIGILALIVLPVMAAVTAMMGGLMDRYRMDAAVFAVLAFICGIIEAHRGIQVKSENWKKAARIVLLFFTILSVIVSGLTYGTEGLNYLLKVNPEAYISIAHAVEFWR